MIELTARHAAFGLLAFATIGWYASSRGAAQALAGGLPAPGRRAIAYSLGNLLVVVAALARGQADIAVAIIFATSVAALTLVLGILTLTANPATTATPRRIWGFVLPVALIALMVGFRGSIGLTESIILLIEGFVLMLVWNDPVPSEKPAVPLPPAMGIGRFVVLAFSLLAAAVASVSGVLAVRAISNGLSLPSAAMATSLMLAPAMVLPLIGWGSAAAHEGRFDQAVSTLVGFVLINLCALLPLAAMLWLARPTAVTVVHQLFPTSAPASTLPATTSASSDSESDNDPRPLVYPMTAWRIDTVLLIAVGMLLLPIALGRWAPGPVEGSGLLLAYVAYMFLCVLMAR